MLLTRLYSQEVWSFRVYGGLPGSFGDLSGMQQGGCHQCPMSVLRPLDAVQGEDDRNTVDGRVIVPR